MSEQFNQIDPTLEKMKSINRQLSYLEVERQTGVSVLQENLLFQMKQTGEVDFSDLLEAHESGVGFLLAPFPTVVLIMILILIAQI